MKKKVKLFSTIASLCLAVALMAFGVWAATTASIGMTSTVRYTVSGQVNMEFKVEVEYTTAHLKPVTNQTIDKGNYKTAVKADDATKTVNSWSFTQVPGQTALAESINLGDYEFNDQSLQGDTVVYTITIKNNAEEPAWVEVTGFTATTNMAVTSAAVGESKSIAKDEMFTYVATFTLSDATKTMSADEKATFTPTFAITANATTKPGA